MEREQAQFQGPTDLLSLVRKREKTLQYIKKGHRGNHHWLNTAKLTTEMIHKRKEKKTIEQWFVLGMSLGSLLDFSHGSQIVRSFLQLMEEFDYFMSNNSAKNMRLILNAKPLRSAEDGSPDESPIRPCLKKSQNGKIFFESLRTLHIPCELDYCRIVITLCETVIVLYKKLLDGSCSSKLLVEGVVKLDQKINDKIIHVLSNELTELSAPLMNSEIDSLIRMLPEDTFADHD
eukprot:414069_1